MLLPAAFRRTNLLIRSYGPAPTFVEWAGLAANKVRRGRSAVGAELLAELGNAQAVAVLRHQLVDLGPA